MLHLSTTAKPVSGLPRAIVCAAALLWLLLAVFGPRLAQSVSYHGFADQRAWGLLPHAMDVLSNLGFLIAGLAGLWMLHQLRNAYLDRTSRAMATLFFVGLIGCFAGSSYYHLAPHDAALLWDRLAMCLPFAGMLGLAVRQVTEDDAAAWFAALAMLIGAVVSALIWREGGNMLPWAVAQGSGMLALIALACMPSRKNRLHVHIGVVIGFYALAKVFELADAQVFEMNCGLISGHSVKHLLAAAAAWPVLDALGKRKKR